MSFKDDKKYAINRTPNFRPHNRSDNSDERSLDRNDDRNSSKNKAVPPSKPNTKEEVKNASEDIKPKIEQIPEQFVSKEKKFSGRCQLFVGNIQSDMNDADFKKLFEKFGPCKDVYLCANRGFGFIRMETRHIAERARAELDGRELRGGRYLRVRMACHTAAIKVKYLSPIISNEILEQTFSMFGEVERAVVVVDDKGKPIGEGIVEFARKQAAFAALKRISEGVFLMTSQPRPISVERYDPIDEMDGLPELFVLKSQEMTSEREKGARFAQVGSLEAEMGHKWKKLYQLYAEQEDLLKKNFADEVAKLEADQVNVAIEQRKHMIMQDVQRRQEELRMLEKTIDDNKRRMEFMHQDSDRKRPHLFDDDMRGHHRNLKDDVMMPGARRIDLNKNPDPQQHQPQHSQHQPQQFMQNRGMEGRVFPSSMQAPPIPPGIDRIRMGGLGFLGGNTNNNILNNPGLQANLRMGLLNRPINSNNNNNGGGGAGNGNGGLLLEPIPRAPQQGIRFDNAASFASGGNHANNNNTSNSSSNASVNGGGTMKTVTNLPLLGNYSNPPHPSDNVKRPRRY